MLQRGDRRAWKQDPLFSCFCWSHCVKAIKKKFPVYLSESLCPVSQFDVQTLVYTSVFPVSSGTFMTNFKIRMLRGTRDKRHVYQVKLEDICSPSHFCWSLKPEDFRGERLTSPVQINLRPWTHYAYETKSSEFHLFHLQREQVLWPAWSHTHHPRIITDGGFFFFLGEEGGSVNPRIMQMQVDSLPSKISLYNPPDDLAVQYGLIFCKA